ncbi:MAG: alkaline phosphatase family protein [Deltaproteobacteria bacterium]|nr:alkaline phosphatase family protein [Deltaproteobacteria bacterium]MBI3295849.1 alkaline phosphatase family protein [Deltaproteobacteria bacterium]
MMREILIALSLANLMPLFTWGSLVAPVGPSMFGSPHFFVATLSMFAFVLLLGTLIFFYRRIVWQSSITRYKSGLLFLPFILLIFPFNFLRMLLNVSVHFPIISYSFWAPHPFLLILGLITFVGAFHWWTTHLRAQTLGKLERLFLSVSFPILVLTFAQGSLSLIRYPFSPSAHSSPGPGLKTVSPVVTVLFDEMTWGAVDPATRPDYLNGKLPEIERLTRESFYATNCHSPAFETLDTIPVYFSPARRPAPPGASLFQELHNSGVRSSVVGWFYPYCATYGTDLENCAKIGGANYAFTLNPLENLIHLFKGTFHLAAASHAHNHQLVSFWTQKALGSDNWDYLHLHWPVPHLPHSYDPEKDQFIHGEDLSEHGYLANMVLVDKTVGQIRAELEHHGLWNKVTLVITADHPVHSYRNWASNSPVGLDRRIPLIVHIPHQTESLRYEAETNTNYFSQMVTNLLLDRHATAQDFAQWVAAQPAFHPTEKTARLR